MADYEAVPRALSRLARTAREVLPIRAEREASRARLGLGKARTEFDIGRAKKTEAHRERVWEAGKEPRALAAVKAKREQEEIARGEEPVSVAEFYRGARVEDLHFLTKHVEPDLEKRLGIERHQDPETGKSTMLKHGKPYKKWEVQQDRTEITRIFMQHIDPERFVETLADDSNKDQPGHEKAKEMIRKGDQVAIYKHGLKVLRRFAPGRGASRAEIAQYSSQEKYIQGQIKHYQDLETKEKIAKIKATGKIPTVGGVKIGTKEERKEGGQVVTYRMTKKGWKEIARGPRKVKEPKEKKEPTAANFTSVIKLIERVTQKGEREPTADNVAMIDEAARAIGYEYKKIKGPIKPEEKRWWWFDPETKERWTLRKAKPGVGKPGEAYRGKITQTKLRETAKPKPERADPADIRRFIK